MADDKNPKSTQKPPEPAGKSYKVLFSGISDKGGNLRLQGETVTADELADPEFQLSVGAIAEVAGAPASEPPKGEQGRGEPK